MNLLIDDKPYLVQNIVEQTWQFLVLLLQMHVLPLDSLGPVTSGMIWSCHLGYDLVLSPRV